MHASPLQPTPWAWRALEQKHPPVCPAPVTNSKEYQDLERYSEAEQKSQVLPQALQGIAAYPGGSPQALRQMWPPPKEERIWCLLQFSRGQGTEACPGGTPSSKADMASLQKTGAYCSSPENSWVLLSPRNLDRSHTPRSLGTPQRAAGPRTRS